MGYDLKKHPGEFTLRIIVTTFVAVLFSNILVAISKLFTATVSGKWSSVLVAIIGFILLILGILYRPGEEKFSDFLVVVSAVTVVGAISVALGLSFFNYVTDVATVSGLVITAGTLFLSEAIYLRIKKAL